MSLGARKFGASLTTVVSSAVRGHVASYELATPFSTGETVWDARSARVAFNYEIDGSAVRDGGCADDFDVSGVVVLDGLVDEQLRQDLLALVGVPTLALFS